MGQRKNSESPLNLRPRLWQDEKSSFLIVHRAQNLSSLLFCQKHYTINIAAPSSMQDVSLELRNRPCSLKRLCGSMVEHWSATVRGSEVRFLMETQNFFSLSHTHDKTKKSFLIIWTVWQTVRRITKEILGVKGLKLQ